MKRTCFVTWIVLCSITLGLSQRIYFCNNFTNTGDPIQTSTTWSINSTGGNVYVLFQNGSRPMNVSSVSFYVDILTGNQYEPWDTKFVTVTPDKTWCVLDYKFTTAGQYAFTTLINGVEVAKEYTTIKLKDNAVNNTSNVTNVSSNTLYYNNSSVTPGTSIEATTGKVSGMNGPFYLDSQYNSRVYFKVSNGDKTLGTQKLIVDINKKNVNGEYVFYKTLNFNISDLNWIFFYYDFTAAGTYELRVYNANSVWINTAFVTIN